MTEKKLGSDSMYHTKKQVYCSENSTGIQLKGPDGRIIPHNSKPIYREEISHGMSQRLYIASNYSYSAYKWAEEMSISTCKEILGLGEKDNWIYTKHFPILVVKLQYILADEFLKQEQL